MRNAKETLHDMKVIATEMQDPYMVIPLLLERLREELDTGSAPEIGKLIDAITENCEAARRAIRAAYDKAASHIAAAEK